MDKMFATANGNAVMKGNRRSKCPTCRSDLNESELVINLLAKQFIDKVIVKCPEVLHEDATEFITCNWMGPIGDLRDHQSVCTIATYNLALIQAQCETRMSEMDYAINRIAPVKLFKCHSRMLKLSATSYCMKHEVRLPNLPIPPNKTYSSFMDKFMELDLHRTLHSRHDSAILDANDQESNTAFVELLMSLCKNNSLSRLIFQGGLVLYLATIIESIVYLLLLHTHNIQDETQHGIEHAMNSLFLAHLKNNRGENVDKLRPFIAKCVQRIAETPFPRTTTLSIRPDETVSQVIISTICSVIYGFLSTTFYAEQVIRQYDNSLYLLSSNELSRQCDEDILNLVGLTVNEAVTELDDSRCDRVLIDSVRRGILTTMQDKNAANIIISDADTALLRCGYYGTKGIGFATDYRCTVEYSALMDYKPEPSRGFPQPVHVSRSKKAKLVFSVYCFEKLIRDFGITRVGRTAPVYLAAICEYISAEILELSGNVASINRCRFISREHVYRALVEDEELRFLFTFVVPNPFTGALYRKDASYYRSQQAIEGDWWETDTFEATKESEPDTLNQQRIFSNDIAGLSPQSVDSLDANGFTPDRLLASIMGVLAQVHPNMNHDDEDENRYSDGILAIAGLIELLAIQLIKTGNELRTLKTFSSKDVQAAVILIMGKDLSRYAVSEGTKAVTKFQSSSA